MCSQREAFVFDKWDDQQNQGLGNNEKWTKTGSTMN